ncbi:MAG: FAD-dependent thymidylate synthase [Candidatus Schekmanbacteria bacterium]|nr:FAD-dependent thymidylate synthase [Candidatus Schekmanbacteria bacterium]
MPLNVILLKHTPQPEETVALAAKLCYSPLGIEDLKQKNSSSDIEKFLNKITAMGHTSVLEHATFTFGIEGISRVTSHQLVRHRIASYSQQSQRYVQEKGQFDYIVPPTVADNEKAKEAFDKMMRECQKLYDDLVACGVAVEDARYVLPNACETKIVVTMNARELHHFFTLRCCMRAQWEIRQMAMLMLERVKAVAPLLFQKCGPNCLTKPCPEGQLSCGKQAEIKRLFTEMDERLRVAGL